MNFRLLQLADSAYPAGGFAHSGGVEALRQAGLIRSEADLRRRLTELTWASAFAMLPFFDHAHRADAVEADRQCEVFLSNHVANRASRAQGGAFAMAAEATFAVPFTSSAAPLARSRDAGRPSTPVTLSSVEGLGVNGVRLPFGHLAATMGATLSAVHIDLDDARGLYLFGAVRAAVSASVRLGCVGPLRAQAITLELHAPLQAALAATHGLTMSQARTLSPVLELYQSGHDGLYSRLFQS